MINNKRILAVILARKGSKGIPGKNYKPICGEPLVYWSILAAIKSKYVDKVAISSNCYEVKKVYYDFLGDYSKITGGIDITNVLWWIERPEEYSTDTSKNEEALIHAYEEMKDENKWKANTILCLQPTSPCRYNGLIDKCIEEYEEKKYNSLLTADPETPFIWQKINGEWKYTVDKNNCCKRKMRQQFKEEEIIWHDSGNIYMTSAEVLVKTKCRIGDKHGIYETDKIQAMQIDQEDDFAILENIIKTKNICLV